MRALDEDTRGFSVYFSSPLGQTAVSGNSTLHQWHWESLFDLWNLPFFFVLGIFVFFLIFCESLKEVL